ncbi:HSP90 family protein [Agreia pratensis]|uniref:Molecular chaperone HtpG n=1 Tax=Agreia pratensis TaxID=150121 RepID=A0A1X7JKD1_9MICO|nr:HSP90 family protein [Agreia pratensis]SMG28377.1 molecular chaperone HtpG [Agreia pratensis]
MSRTDGVDAGASRPFQVDLRGVVDLLSRHIYSSPQVFLRELMQNGRDAVVARRQHAVEPIAGGGGIWITPADGEGAEFVFRDDGIGLTLADVGELLATVGRSSKRDLFDLPRTDYLGQFGIGLLSCFMVADRIVIRSRSAAGGPGVEWIGATDGTYTARELDEHETAALAIGTEVRLVPLAGMSELLSSASVVALATRFGEFLDLPVRIALPRGGEETINRDAVFLQSNAEPTAELVAYGAELLGATPFDAIPLVVPGTATRGVAFVLPYAPPPGSRQSTRVYLGRMLLGERIDELLPDWAFFVRAVIDTEGLQPTASREQLVENESLEYTRSELGAALRRWILQKALAEPHRLAEFVAIHHVALKSLVVHDDELAGVLARWLSVETSAGPMTLDAVMQRSAHVRYAETVDEFRQVAAFGDRSSPIVNGGYIYDAEIVRRLPDIVAGVTVERVTVLGELDNLDSPPMADRPLAHTLEERAAEALRQVSCDVDVRGFEPADLPALAVADPDALRSIGRAAAQETAPPLWGSVLGRVDKAAAAHRGAQASGRLRLCLNWNNPLVRTLAATNDDAVFSRSIQLVYVQALLAGHRPLQAADRRMLTSALSDLVHLSVGLPGYPSQESDPS